MKIPILVSVAQVNADVLERLEQQNVGIELSYFSYPSNLTEEKLPLAIKEYQQLLKDFPLPITMHGAFYDLSMTARDPKIVDVSRFRIHQSLDIAYELGIKKLVFHTNYIHSNRPNYKAFWIEKQVAFWKTLIPKIEQQQVTLHLENTREEDYSYIATILDQLQHPQFKTCYDTGHSHCFTKAQHQPVEWVKGYQQQLSYIHLHSNNGFIDQHIAFTQGTVNFDGFFEAIQALEQAPYLVIEVATREDYLNSLKALRALGF